jgi:hypothetical protein
MPSSNEGQPEGTKRVAQVLRSFAFTPKQKDAESLWITSETPRAVLETIPQDVLDEHEKTGYVTYVNVPDSPVKE